MCAGTVAEVIQSVVNGADGCVFCFGHSKLGKTLTHAHTHTKTTKSELGSWVFFSECDHRCVGSSLGRRSTSPHLSERERRGLVSAEAESILSLLCLCFCLPFSPSNPSEAGCQRGSLKKRQGPSLHSATCLIPDIHWDKQRPTTNTQTHTRIRLHRLWVSRCCVCPCKHKQHFPFSVCEPSAWVSKSPWTAEHDNSRDVTVRLALQCKDQHVNRCEAKSCQIWRKSQLNSNHSQSARLCKHYPDEFHKTWWGCGEWANDRFL